jgi:hypothetical protein
MKRLMLVAIATLVMGFVSSAFAADATGTWKWTTTFNNQSREATLKLKQEGDKLSGVYVGQSSESPIEDAKVAGDKISFKVTRERNGQKFTTAYSGTLKDDTITGTQDRERDGQKQSSEWVAKRQK